MSEVEWRPFPLDERYMVGSDGTILSQAGNPLKVGVTVRGRSYIQTVVHLGLVKSISVHRVVARTFLGPTPEGQEIDHLDNNPLNNAVENLQFVTRQENMRLMGERTTHCRKAGHSREDAYIVSGRRVCRPCRLEDRRAYVARKKAQEPVAA